VDCLLASSDDIHCRRDEEVSGVEVNESREASLLRVAQSVVLTPSSAGDSSHEDPAAGTPTDMQRHAAGWRDSKTGSGIASMLHDFDALLGIGCDSDDAAKDAEDGENRKSVLSRPLRQDRSSSIAGFARFDLVQTYSATDDLGRELSWSLDADDPCDKQDAGLEGMDALPRSMCT